MDTYKTIFYMNAKGEDIETDSEARRYIKRHLGEETDILILEVEEWNIQGQPNQFKVSMLIRAECKDDARELITDYLTRSGNTELTEEDLRIESIEKTDTTRI
jgi:hypothetical protein